MEGKKVNLFWSATEAATCEATAAAVAASVLESRSLITKVMEMKWKEIFLKMKGRMSFACSLLRRDCWLEMIHRRYRLLWFTMYLKMIVLTI